MTKDMRPEPPREAALITTALKRSKLSARAAAQRTGISDARWRQITSGYQSVSGTQVPVRAPADTLARMARTVGVTPEQLEEADRQDAAEELRNLSQPSAALPPGDRNDPRVRALAAIWETLTPAEQERELRHLRQHQQQDADAPVEPPYADLADDTERTIWDMDIPEDKRRVIIDLFRNAHSQQHQNRA